MIDEDENSGWTIAGMSDREINFETFANDENNFVAYTVVELELALANNAALVDVVEIDAD